MVRLYPGERFEELAIDYPLKFRYAVSNRGRLLSFTERFEGGQLLKGGDSRGRKTFKYNTFENGKRGSRVFFVYKLVAQHFLPKPSDAHQYVLHLNYKLDNDHVTNLRWATYEEQQAHLKKNPNVIRSKRMLIEHNLHADGRKLTVTKVIHLKKLLQDPKRKTRLKMLAKQFGISEMQVCRIKSGENWGWVVV
jgi:hypothetical protein